MAEEVQGTEFEDADNIMEMCNAVSKAVSAMYNSAAESKSTPKQLRRQLAIYKFATADLLEAFKDEIPVNKRGPRNT